jgi:hypothetical protein
MSVMVCAGFTCTSDQAKKIKEKSIGNHTIGGLLSPGFKV